MTNQYKAASELQSCIVPTDFRILCRNWPSAAAGRGWRMGSPVPPAWKHWAVQTQSWSLSGQQDPGCRCPEGPVYSNNSTRPSVWAEARHPPGARIPRQLPSVPYLPASQRWGGGGGNVLGTQPGPTDFKARVWCSDCTGTGPLTLAIWAPVSKAQLKSPPLRSPLGVLASKCPALLYQPSLRKANEQQEWTQTGVCAAPPTSMKWTCVLHPWFFPATVSSSVLEPNECPAESTVQILSTKMSKFTRPLLEKTDPERSLPLSGCVPMAGPPANLSEPCSSHPPEPSKSAHMWMCMTFRRQMLKELIHSYNKTKPKVTWPSFVLVFTYNYYIPMCTHCYC